MASHKNTHAYLSLHDSDEVGLASRVISASESNLALLLTELMTLSTVEGSARLGVPVFMHVGIPLLKHVTT